jgi:hypothetical protein
MPTVAQIRVFISNATNKSKNLKSGNRNESSAMAMALLPANIPNLSVQPIPTAASRPDKKDTSMVHFLSISVALQREMREQYS